MHKFIEQKSGINKVKTVVAAVAIAILTGCSSGSGDGSSDVTPVTPVESLSSSSDNILVMGASMQISVTTKAEKSTLRIGKESSEVHDLKFNFKNAQYNDKFTILYGNSCSHFSSLDPCVITLLPKSSAVDLLGENIEYTISGVIGPSANRSTIQGSFILKSLTSTITGNEYRTGLGAGHSATISISNQTGKVVDLSKSQLVSQDPDLSFSQNNCTSIISNDQNCTIVVNASSQSNSKKVAFDLKNQYGTTVLSSAVPIVRPIISISSSLEENQKLLPNEEMALTVKNVSPVSALSLKLNKTLAEGVKISSNTCQEILPALSQCTISLQAGSFANGKSNFIVNGNNFNQVEHSVLAYTPLWMSVALSRHHLVTNNLADKKLIVTVENTSSNLDLHNINLSFSTPISDLEVISRLSSCKHLQDNTLIPKATCRYTLSYQPDSIQSVQSLDTTLIIKDDEHHQVSEAISINHYPAYYSIPNNLKRYHQNIAGSHVNAIYIQNKHIYAATASGLSISKDEGKTWQNKTVADGLLSNDIRAVFVFDNTIYAATASGLSISKDEGKTWQNKTVADGLASNNLTAVYVSNSDIYAASASGLSISKDGGKTWEKQTAADGLASDNINDIYVFSNTIYAATSSGLSISKDEGKTWITRTISNGLPSDNIQNVYVTKGYIIDGDPSIYVATSNGISVSNNEGESWESYLQDKYIHAVYVKGAYIYAATESGLYISDDNYKNWQIKTTTDGLGNNIINQVVLSDDKVYVATIGGLSISKDNAKTWNNHTSSYPFENEIIRDVYYKNGVIYLASSSGGIYISKDGGVTWKNATVENGLGSNLVWRIYVEGNTIYAATHDGLSISYDDGANWQNKTVADGLVSNYIRDVIAEGDRIYVATMKGVSMSEDAGKTWSSPITSTDMQGLFISQGILYAASLDRGIYISKDNGTNWSNVQIKDGDSLFNRASGLYVNSGIIYVATAGGIAISKDEGKNWDYQVLSQNETIGVIEIEVSGSTMYALTSKNGLYTSKDNGVTWTIKTPANGVSSHSINSIAISGSNIYLGTTKGLSVTTKTAEGKWENHVITSDVN
ncbi:YCF48-related protein, partial [Fangia hongkongensis]|uniref:YCF48-related protein n=1 Tax=Fangia hongkongensis TaxID=270495 RepID=UPI001906FA39